jgi:hypothetical protein
VISAPPGEEEIQTLRKEVRHVESDLVETVKAIRERISYEALKDRALSQVRQVAVERPKRLARSAAADGFSLMKSIQRSAKERPIIPVLIGIAVLTPILIMRIMRRRP